MDADKSFGFALRNDEKIPENKTVHVQIAVLYSNIYGERRLRVFNQAFKVATLLNQYFKSCAVESFTQYFLREKLARIKQVGPRLIREEVMNEMITIFLNYRLQCASTSSSSQLVIPDSLKLMPIYILSAMKSPAFKLLSTNK